MIGERYFDVCRTLQKEARAAETDRYFELDEIQLVKRYDQVHALEIQQLDQEQRQLADFVIQSLLSRIEFKISPSFRRQLEEEAQQTNFQEDPMYGRNHSHQH